MKRNSPGWSLTLLLVICFTLATVLVPRSEWWNAVPQAADWNKIQGQSDSVFKLLFGEGRRLFGNEMFDMADAYFHSGYYPSIFDRPVTEHDVAERHEDNSNDRDDFLGPPPDWIAALDRHFVPNRHTHLDAGGASGEAKAASIQEILPWLKLATDLNPQYIDAYRVGYYWLSRLHKPQDARAFLLEGLRNNPGNSELLFDLGSLYNRDFHDSNRARNVWVAALRSWQEEPDTVRTNVVGKRLCSDITINLAHLEEETNNWSQAILYLKMTKEVSPNPDAIQKQIEEAERKVKIDH